MQPRGQAEGVKATAIGVGRHQQVHQGRGVVEQFVAVFGDKGLAQVDWFEARGAGAGEAVEGASPLLFCFCFPMERDAPRPSI